ncbi:hypothetical protein EPUL_001347 [Erysiphe pulchra]|uniref:Uncharacterized protein n=1 Tax=Erysiphe pulchra TaxID=225359 RepID=A0A2S4PZP7_9PEZI|nr:hypothetical protein EPUL_001347 [Erysiphe pulchra]
MSGFRKEALKEKTIKSTFKKSGLWPNSCKNALLSRSRYVGLQACVAEQRMRRTKARKTTHRSRGINLGQWKTKISENESLENAKAIRKIEGQIQIAVNKAQKLLVTTGTLALFREPDRDFGCRTVEENSSLRPPPDLQLALDFLIEKKELRWLLEGSSSDIEISLKSQYLNSVALPFDSECEGDDPGSRPLEN